MLDDKLREQLDRMWGAGIDYATSPDFKELSVDEKDALYERYKTNVGNEAIAQIRQAFADDGWIKARPDDMKDYLITGQQWYDRLMSEFLKVNRLYTADDNEEDWMAKFTDFVEAAKKVSGVE